MKIFKIIITNLTLFIILLLFSEIGIRVFFPNHNNYRRTYPQQYKNRYFDSLQISVKWPKFSKEFGWVCNDNVKKIEFTNSYYNNLGINYSINKDGFRFNGKTISSGSSKIMMLGDSFVFSVYLEDTLTISSNLQRYFQNKFAVYNYGIPGWGIDQMYLCFLKYNIFLSPDIVILSFIDDDIYRVLEAYRFTEGMNKPSLELVNDTLVLRNSSSISFMESVFQKSKFLNPFYKWHCKNEAIKITQQIFITLANITKKQKFYIVHIPVIEQVLFPDKYSPLIVDKFYYKNNINYIELGDNFKKFKESFINKLYLKNDGHLSERGTKVVARVLFNEIMRDKN